MFQCRKILAEVPCPLDGSVDLAGFRHHFDAFIVFDTLADPL